MCADLFDRLRSDGCVALYGGLIVSDVCSIGGAWNWVGKRLGELSRAMSAHDRHNEEQHDPEEHLEHNGLATDCVDGQFNVGF